MTFERQWYRIPEAYSMLGFPSAESLRKWIRSNRKQGTLRLNTHIKLLYPNRVKPTWLVHVENCSLVSMR